MCWRKKLWCEVKDIQITWAQAKTLEKNMGSVNEASWIVQIQVEDVFYINTVIFFLNLNIFIHSSKRWITCNAFGS